MGYLDTLLSYINQCDEVIESNNIQKAKQLCKLIISVYNNDIPNLQRDIKYVTDIRILKANLIHLKETKEETLKQEAKNSVVNIYNSNQNDNTSNATTNITITLEQAIEQIQKIPEENLSEDDKSKLVEDINDLEELKKTENKDKFWNKAKDVLKFIADKGADVAIATLPLIIQGLNGLN